MLHGDSPLEQVMHAWNLIELLVFQVQPVPATGTAEGLVSSPTQHISPLLSALYFFHELIKGHERSHQKGGEG